MAISVDATSSGTSSAGTTVTVSHTCTGSDLVLIVVAESTSGVGTPTCTYNGVSMTLAVTANTASTQSSWTFYLLNPATGANNIVLTKDSGVDYGVIGISFTGAGGVSATAGADSTGSGTASVTVNTATSGNGFVVAGGSVNTSGTVTYAGSGTEFANFLSNNGLKTYEAAYQSFAAGADITHSWTFTSNRWALTGIEVYEKTTAKSGFFMFM